MNNCIVIPDDVNTFTGATAGAGGYLNNLMLAGHWCGAPCHGASLIEAITGVVPPVAIATSPLVNEDG